MEIDVTKIPSLGEGYVVTDANGNVSVEGLGANQSSVLYLNANGYAGTPEIGNANKPYQTHTAALAAATTGTTIIVIGQHNTTINLMKSGQGINYFAPTPNDGITYTDDFTSMIGDSSDAVGSAIGLYGEGYFKATGSGGAPCIIPSAVLTETNIIIRCGLFQSNATIVLSGGTGGLCIFEPKKHIHTGTGQVFNAYPSTGGSIFIGGFTLELTSVLIGSPAIIGVSNGDDDSYGITKDIIVTSTVTQTNTPYLLNPHSTPFTGVLAYGNIHCYVSGVKAFNNLTTGVGNPYKLSLVGDVSVVDDIGITTALNTDLEFTGVGAIKANDRTINLTNPPLQYVNNQTASFNTPIGLANTEVVYDSASAGVMTINTDACVAVGESFTTRQKSTAGLSPLAGTNVEIINNTGVLATTAIGDILGYMRIDDNGGNQVYIVIA